MRRKAPLRHRITKITAATKTAALTGEVHKLKDSYYMAAAAAKAAALEIARTNAAAAMSDKGNARTAYNAKVEEERNRERQRGLPGERGLSRDVPLTPQQEQQARGRGRCFECAVGQRGVPLERQLIEGVHAAGIPNPNESIDSTS